MKRYRGSDLAEAGAAMPTTSPYPTDEQARSAIRARARVRTDLTLTPVHVLEDPAEGRSPGAPAGFSPAA
jgi:hypothetical protein